MNRQRGFTLLELLIAVAIIFILAAIAVPSFIHSRMAANEASAAYSIRTIITAQTAYAASNPTVGFAIDLNTLGSTGLVDWVLGCPSQPCFKSGYQFEIRNASGSPMVSSYRVIATPANSRTGRMGFCSDQGGVIYVDPDGGAACTIPLGSNSR